MSFNRIDLVIVENVDGIVQTYDNEDTEIYHPVETAEVTESDRDYLKH